MRRRKSCNRITGRMLALVLGMTMLTGCGAADKTAEYAESPVEMVAEDAAMDGGIYENAAAAAEEQKAEGAQEAAADRVQEQNRKLIRNVDMTVETEDFDTLVSHVEQKVTSLGGYIENSSIYNGSYTSEYRSRSAQITARIPADKLDSFVEDVAAQSNITNKSESVEDVTLQYVDLESHKKALLAEQESLLAMLENAESTEDIIVINEQLTQVRYQIESMESQLRTYDNKISYSTVYLSVEEVEQYIPYKPKTAGERISEGFVRNLRRVGNGLVNFGIEFIIALPIIVAVLVIGGLLLALVFAIIKASDKRLAGKRQNLPPRQGNQNAVPGSYHDRYRRQPDEAGSRQPENKEESKE